MSENAEYNGIYMMWLLFQDKCEMPTRAEVLEKLTACFGKVDVVSSDSEIGIYGLCSHMVTYEDNKKVPSQLMITGLNEINEPHGDTIARTQFWDCPDGVALLDSCKYHVMLSDFMAAGLPPVERAGILANWLDIGLRLFPTCTAVYIDASGKLMTAESLRSETNTESLRFIRFVVNVRFFTVQGTEDSVVDTLGLYAIGLPDIQYHFHGLNPDDVVNHAYNVAIYQFENDASIKSGQTVAGFEPDSYWRCQYESSLIKPSRNVLDIEMGEFASGNRRQ